MIIKCKMCGGDLRIEDGTTVAECEYCGTKQTVPNADNEKKIKLFERANRLRAACEFDKAAGVYESIVADFDTEAEAYWGLILCKFGIEYVDDPATGDKVPTCHRSSFDSVLEDPNFELVMENSDAISRKVYRDEAKAIEELRRSIIEVSSKEEPYDVFISYKELDASGERTIDSVIAQDIYKELTNEGYRVFFSRISLESKLGVEYEPYIFAALNSARVMIVVGTDYDNFNAVWVKNEWSRYLALIASGQKKTLIPCFKNIDAYDMPREFNKLAAQDMGKVGAMQDLLRGVEKLLGKNEGSTAAHSDSKSAVAPLLKRAFMFLEDREWEEADKYCEKVLDQDPENAQAYLGKLMAECCVRRKEDLKDCRKPFADSNNFKKALRFGDAAMQDKLNRDIQFINDRIKNEYLKGLYEDAEYLMNFAKTAADLQKAAEMFGKISEFKDSTVKAEECVKKISEASQQADEIVAFLNSSSGEEKVDLPTLKKELDNLKTFAVNFSEYDAEKKALECEADEIEVETSALQEKRSRLSIFSGKEKRIIDEKVNENSRKLAEINSKIEEHERKLRGYTSKEQIEKKIQELQREIGQRETCIADNKPTMSLDEVKNYLIKSKVLRNMVVTKLPSVKNIPSLSIYFAEEGNSVLFGKYKSTEAGDRKPIKWRVLAEKENAILVISEYILDYKFYNDIFGDVTWESCALRKWLNNEFLNSAFDKDEQKLIKLSEVVADQNPRYATDPGNNTIDKVFLLSINEAKKLSKDIIRCESTPYAFSNYPLESTWCLRTPGKCQPYVATVSMWAGGVVDIDYSGGVHIDGGDGPIGIRPVLWINLDA